MRSAIKTSCRRRLGRIEGQVRGVARMIEADRYCVDIVTQVAAVRAALARVEQEILRDHAEHCVAQAVASADRRERRRKVAELMAALMRAGR